LRILIAFVLALTFAAPEVAAEKVRVPSFGGSKRMAKKIRKDVIKVVRGKDYKIVRSDYDGVIKGKVKQRGKRYKLYLRLIDRNGEVTERVAVRITRRGFTAKQRRLLRKKLRKAIRKLPGEPEPEPEPEPEDEDESFDEGDEPDDVASAGDDDDDDDDDDSDSRVSKSMSARKASGRANGHVHVGASVIRRSFGFGGDIGNYKGVPAGGAHVDAVVFPLAFGGKAEGWKDKVGVGLDFDRSFGLKSSFTGDETTQLPTTQSRIAVDARYRIELGDKKTRPTTIQAAVGIERLSFNIDRANAPAGVQIMVPDTAYTSLRPGAEAWIPVNPKIAVIAAAHLKVILGAGQIVTAEQYGTGAGLGYDFTGGVEYLFTRTIGLRAGLQYDRVNLSFNGDGDLSTMGDFTKSSDSYIGGFATVGFVL
jgi:hypothetical protein